MMKTMPKTKLRIKKAHVKKKKDRYFNLFEEFLEEGICKKAKNNFDEDYQVWSKYTENGLFDDNSYKKIIGKITYPDNILDALFNAFDWEKSPEGGKYWDGISTFIQKEIKRGNIARKYINKNVHTKMVGPVVARFKGDEFSPVFLLNPSEAYGNYLCDVTILWHEDPKLVGTKDTVYFSKLEQLDYPVTIKFDR